MLMLWVELLYYVCEHVLWYIFFNKGIILGNKDYKTIIKSVCHSLQLICLCGKFLHNGEPDISNLVIGYNWLLVLINKVPYYFLII